MPYNEQGAGYQNTDTSKEAARRAPLNLRAKVLQAVKDFAPASADEIADILKEHFISVRPRITELKNDGLIVDSGGRAVGVFGREQIRWKPCEVVKETE